MLRAVSTRPVCAIERLQVAPTDFEDQIWTADRTRSMESVARSAAALAAEASRSAAALASRLYDASKDASIPAHLFDTAQDRMSEITPALLSDNSRDQIDALKRLIALTSKGVNVSSFFAHVVKLVASPSFEMRKLVYVYLLRYASEQPDLALLSINTFQKDTADKNPIIRAMAIRVMSSIRVPTIAPIISVVLRKGVSDLSPLVRKATATAIMKCYELDPSQMDVMMDTIIKLLRDKSPLVITSTLASFNRVCADRLDLISPIYRTLCRGVTEYNEWGQPCVIDILTRYVRRMFREPPKGSMSPQRHHNVPLRHQHHASSYTNLDPDHRLFLDAIRPLTRSRNPYVLVSVLSAYMYTSPSIHDIDVCVTQLLRYMRPTRDQPSSTSTTASAQYIHGYQYSVMKIIESVSILYPGVLVSRVYPYMNMWVTDPVYIQTMKLRILERVAVYAGTMRGNFDTNVVDMCIKEMYTSVVGVGYHVGTSVVAVKCMGRVGMMVPNLRMRVVGLLSDLVAGGVASRVVGESVVVLRRLLVSRCEWIPKSVTLDTVDGDLNIGQDDVVKMKWKRYMLMKKLVVGYDSLAVGLARSSIVWLVGHELGIHAPSFPDLHHNSHHEEEAEDQKPNDDTNDDLVWPLAPDLLRIIAKSFKTERNIDVKTRSVIFCCIVTIRDELNRVVCDARQLYAKITKSTDAVVETKFVTDKITRNVRGCTDYVMMMARYDADIRIRDTERCIRGIMTHMVLNDEYQIPSETESESELETKKRMGLMKRRYKMLIRSMRLVCGYSIADQTRDVDGNAHDGNVFMVGSLSHCVGSMVDGYAPIPAWAVPLNQADEEGDGMQRVIESARARGEVVQNSFAQQSKLQISNNSQVANSSQVVNSSSSGRKVKKRVVTLDEFLNDKSSGGENVLSGLRIADSKKEVVKNVTNSAGVVSGDVASVVSKNVVMSGAQQQQSIQQPPLEDEEETDDDESDSEEESDSDDEDFDSDEESDKEINSKS